MCQTGELITSKVVGCSNSSLIKLALLPYNISALRTVADTN